jgi:hypothetical protein
MTKVALALSAALALVSASGCKSKGTNDGSGGGTGVLAKMTELKTKMCACTDAACARTVSDELTRWMQGTANKKEALDPEGQKKADALGVEMGDCMARVTRTTQPTGSAAGSGSAVAAGSGSAGETRSGSAAAGSDAPSGLPKECDDYKAAVDRLAACEAMSKGARETLVKAYQDASEGWKKLPDAAKDKIRVSCKAGAEAVISAAKTQCGW